MRINSFAHVEEIDPDGRRRRRPHARIRRAIIDKGVKIPAGMEIGYDHEEDRARGLTVEEGVVVVAKEADLTRRNRVFVAEGVETQQ